MEYLYGSGLLFAGFLLTAGYRFYSDSRTTKTGSDSFGGAESAALFTTAVVALAIALFATKAVQDWSLLSLAEMSVALGVLIAACIATWRALARKFASTADVLDFQGGPTAPLDVRHGRAATTASRTSAGAAQRKRAA
jgi:hypothetical protein